MIEFHSVTRRYGPQVVLDEVSFRINTADRVGIVGPNGGGKSTIFALIDGTQFPDKGDVVLPKQTRLGHVHQQLTMPHDGISLLHYTERSIPALEALSEQIDELEHGLGELDEGERTRCLQRIGTLQTEFEHLGGYEMRTRAEAALSGLGFSVEDFDRPFESFSGGWQMRSELARTLIGQPDTLLLDEPSNYLDLPAVEWLQKHLRGFAGTLLLVSHDRFLLEALTDLTLEVRGGRVTQYAGGYRYYEEQREARRAQLEAAKQSQDRKLAQMDRFVDRFRAKNTKASQVQSRIKMMDRIERVELADDGPNLSRIEIPDPPHCGAEIVRVEDVGHAYRDGHWVLRGVDLSIHRGQKMALVGYNGMGKTTLQRILAGELEPTRGKRVLGHQVVVGYQSQDFAETMPSGQSALRIVRDAGKGASEKQVRTILGRFGFSGDAVDKPCKVLSGGEKIRLAFARIFIRPPNFLVLDEPTTHLDLNARRALEASLTQYKGSVCLVSHDLAFVRAVADHVVAMQPPGILPYSGGYDYYCEKRDGSSPEAVVSSAPRPDTDRKAGRKARAAQREQDRAWQRSWKRQLREAERDIEALEAEQETLAAQLENGEQVDYARINRALQDNQQRLRSLNHAWEEAVEALSKNGETS